MHLAENSSANLAFGDVEQAGNVVADILAKQAMPYGVSANIVGQSEELARSYNSLIIALSLAVFLVYLVMASQFENLLQPLLILFTAICSLSVLHLMQSC